MVGGEGPGQGAGIGAAGDGAPRADRSMDHRRYRLSQEGPAFGRVSPTILRRAWQARQLSGRGDVVDRQSRCELAGGLSAVFAEGVGERSQTSAQGIGVPDEISFKTKPEIALAQIRWACEAGLPHAGRC